MEAECSRAGRDPGPTRRAAVIWRGRVDSYRRGREAVDGTIRSTLSRHESRGRSTGIQQLWEIDARCGGVQGMVSGGSFQRRAVRHQAAAEGTRLRLPELTHGVIPTQAGWRSSSRSPGPGVRQRPGAHRTGDAGRGGHEHGVVKPIVPADERQHRAAWRSTCPAPGSRKMARTVIFNLSTEHPGLDGHEMTSRLRSTSSEDAPTPGQARPRNALRVHRELEATARP